MMNTGHTHNWKRFLSPKHIARKVLEHGLINSFRIIVWHLNNKISRITLPEWRRSYSIIDSLRYRSKKQNNVLYAFYDFKVAPVTYDVVNFLVLAELYRKEVGCDLLHLVIVPGPDEGFRKNDYRTYHENGADYKIDIMRWRLSNIVTQCCWLIPSCQKLTVCTSRKEAKALQSSMVKYVFPKGYTVRFPIEFHEAHNIIEASSRKHFAPSIQSTPQACSYINDWIKTNVGGRKLISITLRECNYEHARNSNIKNWGSFARSLDLKIYCPVIIRDADTAFKPLPPDLKGIIIFPEVVWNIELRAALYELSYLNMLIANGPETLCLLNQKVRFLLVYKKNTCGAATHEYMSSQGLEPGSQYQWMNPFQQIVWDDDDYDVLMREFKKMCRNIERSINKELYKDMA